MDDFLLNAWRWGLVAFGVGLVIFVHELGHFLAARWCGVRVETFSLGFGPKLLAWKRGATTYQIAAIPLGGFVRMAGEEATAAGPQPDELPSKTVGQRFLIYSGGVLMNVAFALVVFPIILTTGVPFAEPRLGPSEPGSPAWQAGLEPGTQVLEVNGETVYSFPDILNEVALGSPEQTTLVVQGPGDAPKRTVRLAPRWSEAIGAYAIGVTGPADAESRIEVAPESPAAKAGLEDGDRLVTVHGAPAGLTPLEQVGWSVREGGAVRATFERDGRPFDVEVVPAPQEKGRRRVLGVAAPLRVAALRDTALAHGTGLAADDRVVRVEGRAIRTSHDWLDALLGAEGPVELAIERGGSPLALELRPLAEGEAVRLWHEVALAPEEGSSAVTVAPGSAAAEAGLRDGDVLKRIGERDIESFGDVLAAVKGVKEGEELEIAIVRDGAPLSLRVTPRETDPPWHGFGLQPATYVFRAEGPLQAIGVGFALSWNFLEEAWLTVQRIFLRQVSGDALGGIITIGVVSHTFASDGLAKLFYFLCMLSMNLAFLNVLPIPVLDGGHLLFLLIEKLKGSPVSERVHGYSQLVGVVLIVSLMVYVTFNDVMRWFVN